MPQIAKGGKYVFGWSRIGRDGRLVLPPDALKEYGIEPGDRVILVSGSKSTEGFCVSRRGLMERSIMKGLFEENPSLGKYKTPEGECVRYKGRLYCWMTVREGGTLSLGDGTMSAFSLKRGDNLLSIRGSNVAFVMGAKGPLIAHAKAFKGLIPQY